ncbi:Uncharacterized protein BP5553_10408 [Venustampulla echinocandica]|uniref:Thioredoxin-like fold domain-containing protein n=1 Tax=Venustampulla echinocandica TaxID=2656787 RepID=A0A370T980_9HELO|nr:Uncharacterized protein BP5553_10408 [Venustampulla echinocandica]RDL30130.1 Uncharacterized protein BP5553_10408 [Venustampulla echinocandica]
MAETEMNPEHGSKLIVYRGWLDPGKHVWSPFVIKLEARLRFAGIPYVTEAGSTRTGPKGKIPYIECRGLRPSENSSGFQDRPPIDATLGDSTLIIKRLVEWDVLPDINRKISPASRAQDLAIRALLEDKLYFYHTWERWVENYYPMRDHILSALPHPMRVLVGLIIYRNTTKTLHGQGTSRYTADEIRAFRREIWEGINDLLKSSRAKASSDTPFWVLQEKHPSEADTTLFGFIVSVLVCKACPESRSLVKGFPIILEYAERIHDTYFPDYLKWDKSE